MQQQVQNMTAMQRSEKLADLNLRVRDLESALEDIPLLLISTSPMLHQIRAEVNADFQRWITEALSLTELNTPHNQRGAEMIFEYNMQKLRYEHMTGSPLMGTTFEMQIGALNNMIHILTSFEADFADPSAEPRDVINYLFSEFTRLSNERDQMLSQRAGSITGGHQSLEGKMEFINMLENYYDPGHDIVFEHNSNNNASLQNVTFFRGKIATYNGFLEAINSMLQDTAMSMMFLRPRLITLRHKFIALLNSAQHYYDQSNPNGGVVQAQANQPDVK